MSTIAYIRKKTWKNELGVQIKEARERLGISQKQLAKRVRTKRGSINQYENGRGNPQFKVIAKIAAELKGDFSVLGCRVAASELLDPSKEQLELQFDQDHSFLANIKIRPTRKSITITTHADYGIKSA